MSRNRRPDDPGIRNGHPISVQTSGMPPFFNQRMVARLIPAEMKTTRISSKGQTKTTQRSKDTRPIARPLWLAAPKDEHRYGEKRRADRQERERLRPKLGQAYPFQEYAEDHVHVMAQRAPERESLQ